MIKSVNGKQIVYLRYNDTHFSQRSKLKEKSIEKWPSIIPAFVIFELSSEIPPSIPQKDLPRIFL